MKQQFQAVLQDALKMAISTCIAVYLGMGISIFDLTGDGAKAIAAAGISAGLIVLQRWFDRDNTAYGLTR